MFGSHVSLGLVVCLALVAMPRYASAILGLNSVKVQKGLARVRNHIQNTNSNEQHMVNGEHGLPHSLGHSEGPEYHHAPGQHFAPGAHYQAPGSHLIPGQHHGGHGGYGGHGGHGLPGSLSGLGGHGGHGYPAFNPVTMMQIPQKRRHRIRRSKNMPMYTPVMHSHYA